MLTKERTNMNSLSVSFEWNLETITLAAVVGALVLTVILSIIVHIVTASIGRKRTRDLSFNTSRVRIFTLDVDTSKIKYFDKQDMRSQVTMSLETFYRGFEHDQAENLREWIYSFTEGTRAESGFLTVPSRIYTTGKESISLFKITSYNQERRILHFEKITLPGVSTKLNRKADKDFIKTTQQIEEIIANSKKFQKKCLVVFIKLTPKINRSELKNLSTNIAASSIYQPLISTYKYLSKKRFLTHIDDYDACLFDFTDINRYETGKLCKQIISKIEQYYNIKAMPNLYDVNIGCSLVKDFNEPLTITIDKAEKLAIAASGSPNSKFMIEGLEDTRVENAESNEVETEIASLISNKTFRCYFTPVLSLNVEQKLYQTNIKPYGISIDNFGELMTAADNRDQLKELLKASFEVIGETTSSNPDVYCIFHIGFGRISATVETLRRLPKISSKIYLALSLSEIQEFYEAGYDVTKYFQAITNAGIKICLNYDDVNSDAPKGILPKCALFIVASNPEGLHSDERTKSELIAYKSFLQDYKKPIIVNNMLSLADMLFAKDIGYDSFICPSIAGTSSSPYDPAESWKEDMFKQNQTKEEKEESRKIHDVTPPGQKTKKKKVVKKSTKKSPKKPVKKETGSHKTKKAK